MVTQDIINCYTFVPRHEIVLQTEEKNGKVVRVEKININNKKKKVVYSR